jgi:hypothetical protein
MSVIPLTEEKGVTQDYQSAALSACTTARRGKMNVGDQDRRLKRIESRIPLRLTTLPLLERRALIGACMGRGMEIGEWGQPFRCVGSDKVGCILHDILVVRVV